MQIHDKLQIIAAGNYYQNIFFVHHFDWFFASSRLFKKTIEQVKLSCAIEANSMQNRNWLFSLPQWPVKRRWLSFSHLQNDGLLTYQSDIQ